MNAIRRSVVRLILAVLGMLGLSLGAYLGLGWAVRSQDKWLQRWISNDRYMKLYHAYARAAAAALPADSDGDWASDGLEWFEKTDPQNALDHPAIWFSIEGSTLIEREPLKLHFGPNGEMDRRLTSERYFVVNERRRVSGFTRFSQVDVPFVQSHRLRVAARPGWLFAAPGGALSEGELELQLEPDGVFAFDAQPTEQAEPFEESSPGQDVFVIYADANRKSSYRIWASPVWALASMEPTVERVAVEKLNPRWVRWDPTEWAGVGYRLGWEAVPGQAEGVLIEAKDDGNGAAWGPVRLEDAGVTTCDLIGKLGTGGQEGQLRFRVRAIRYSGPGKE